MTMCKRDVEKLRQGVKQEIVNLEAKCKDGSATKEQYQELTKLKRKIK